MPAFRVKLGANGLNFPRNVVDEPAKPSALFVQNQLCPVAPLFVIFASTENGSSSEGRSRVQYPII